MDWVDALSLGWKKEYPQLEFSSLAPLVRLARLSAVLDTVQNDVLEPFELTSSDYGVLATLRNVGRPYTLSPSQLHAQLRLSSGGMTKILKRLEASGLIERKPDAEDGRKIQVALTSRGQSMHDRVFRAFVAASDRLMDELTIPQKAEIDQALKRLHDQLEHHEEGESS